MRCKYRRVIHTAIVTGANQGIGLAVAKALSAQGLQVFGTYLRYQPPPDPSLPEAYFTDRASAPPSLDGVHWFEIDLSRVDAPKIVFDFAEEAFGPVDILVNNASSWVQDTFLPAQPDRFGRSMAQISPETFEKQFGVDARATALLIGEFARRHIERGGTWGRIVSLTSGGPEGFPSEVSYGAAKSALQSYTFAAGHELAPYGVTANVLYPPVTDTGWVNDEVRKKFDVASADEVGEVIAYLCSDAARRISRNLVHMR